MAQPISLKRFTPKPVRAHDQALSPEVSVSSLTKHERLMVEGVESHYGNPEKVLQRKILHLARLLNCTEEEATAYFLHSL